MEQNVGAVYKVKKITFIFINICQKITVALLEIFVLFEARLDPSESNRGQIVY